MPENFIFNMIKYVSLWILFVLVFTSTGFCQLGNDGTYVWNTLQLNHKFDPKYEIAFTNRLYYSDISNRMEYYYLDLTGYRNFNTHFSMGLGERITGSYKLGKWNPGNSILGYGIIYLQAGSVKIKLALRSGYKSFKYSNSQIPFDNLTTIDFFTKLTNKIPKPYIYTELFSELKTFKLQNARLFSGLHLLKKKYIGLDVYYALWESNTSAGWKSYNIYGMATKFTI